MEKREQRQRVPPRKSTREQQGHPDSPVVTGKVSSNLASPSHKAFHHHCPFAVNAHLI